jgi:dihydroxyacetone kinase DhaKLM complex PTS-EIIA-like component DhaM
MKKTIEFIRDKYRKTKPHSYLINILIFIAKVVLFLITKSLAFVISSLYNLGIGLAKKKIYSNKDNYKSTGSFVIIASLCFIIYSIWIIITHKMVNYNLYIGITIATVTFYDIGYSIYAIRKNIKNNNEKNTLLMLVNLATALISLELTQSALLSFTQANVDNSLYNGIIGIVVGFCSLIIGMIIYFKKNK